MFEQTLTRSVSFQGFGIHTGKRTTLTLKPSTTYGIRFFRTDCNNACIPITPQTLVSQQRATAFQYNNVALLTPEHLFAALHALHLTNLDIEINGSEVPIMDGSSLEFYTTLHDVGVRTLDTPINPIIITKPLHVEENEAAILCLPSTTSSFTYRLHYPNFIGSHLFTFTPSTDNFENELAPARTYGFYEEVKALQEKGLALGGTLENAIVIGDDAYMNPLRFPNELCRHKTLDLFGDLWTIQRPIQGHIVGIKSGHALTMKLIQTLTKTFNL